MKIAYLIGAHKDPMTLKLIIDRLSNNNNHFFIHVSKISNIEEFINILPEGKYIHYLSNRYVTRWGGYAQAEFKLELLDFAMKFDNSFERYVFISGQDYPLWDNDRIERFYDGNVSNQIVGCINLSETKYEPYKKKIQRYWWAKDFQIQNDLIFRIMRKITVAFSDILVKLGIKRNMKWKDSKGNQHDVYFGSEFMSITYECAKFIDDFYIDNKRQLRNYFSYTYAPSELILPSILMIKQFKIQQPKDENNIDLLDLSPLTYFKYLPSGVVVFKEDDFNDIKEADKMFFRKIDYNISENLIDIIKRQEKI